MTTKPLQLIIPFLLIFCFIHLLDFAGAVVNNGHGKNKGKTALIVASSIGKNKKLKMGNFASRCCTECCDGQHQWEVGRPNDTPDRTRRGRNKRMAGFCRKGFLPQ
jgi:hypothetical protein